MEGIKQKEFHNMKWFSARFQLKGSHISLHKGRVQSWKDSPPITATLQHNECAAQPGCIAVYNHLMCIVVSQITQHVQYSPAPGKALPCGHFSPLIIFIIISQLRGAFPAFISLVFTLFLFLLCNSSFSPWIPQHTSSLSSDLSFLCIWLWGIPKA